MRAYVDLGYAVRCAEQLRCSVVAQEFWRLRRPVAAEPLMSLKEHFGKAELFRTPNGIAEP